MLETIKREKETMRKPRQRRQMCSHLLIPFLLIMVLVSAQPSAQPAMGPVAIPTQCQKLETGSADDPVGQDLASLALGQVTVKKEEILRRLGDTCDTRAVAAMIGALQEDSPKIRLAAIEGLGKLGGPESAEALIERLSDPDPQTRLALIPAMLAFPAPRMRGLVLNQIARGNPQDTTTPEQARVTGVAMLTFTNMLDTSYNWKALLFQYDLERSGIPAIQPTVDSSLRGLKTTRNGTRELISLLKKHNAPFMRSWAATWLGKLRAEEAKEALQNAAVNDKNAEVKAAAEAALRKLDQRPAQ